MSRLPRVSALSIIAGLALPVAAQAHFQELIPSTDIVPDEGNHSVNLRIVFTHPMEGGPTMDMGQPVQFGVFADGKKADLRGELHAKPFKGKAAFEASYKLKEPGDYVFYLEPSPYWEPAEKHYLVHYTKVVVDLGSGEGWDKLVGLPMEIQPLTRPYGVWAGNVFRGIALKDGKPLPFANVEIEWVNDGSVKAPSDPFVTQVVKTDAEGTFSYVMPRAGWWGFNALTEGEERPGPDGKPVGVELGGTIWVKAVNMK